MDEEETEETLDLDLDLDLDESYLQDICDELAYECVSESLFFIREYVYDKGIPIAENLKYDDLFIYFFV
jgi:hypothetical protein